MPDPKFYVGLDDPTHSLPNVCQIVPSMELGAPLSPKENSHGLGSAAGFSSTHFDAIAADGSAGFRTRLSHS